MSDTKLTKGQRVFPNDNGELWLSEGDYGWDPEDGHWKGRPPGPAGMGNLSGHEVTEHEDGTITVSPSILITTHDNDCGIKWHGYLEKGVWREA